MPIRILLVGAVVFMAAWFTVLKPSEEVIPASPAAPGGAASKPGSFRDTAKAGAATAEKDALGAANANIESETDAPAPAAAAPSATTTAPPATSTATRTQPTLPPLPAKAVAQLPRDVRAGLEARKVIVLGVLNTDAKPWDPMADDDRAVRNALRDVNRYGGKVVVKPVTIGALASYDGMLEALGVTQSPTVVVIDRNRKAQALTGWVDKRSINQAIADARRDSTAKLIRDPFLAKVNRSCGYYDMRFSRLSYPTVRGARAATVRRLFGLAAQRRASIARIKAPAKWRGLKAQILRTLDKDVATTRSMFAAGKRRDGTAFARAYAADVAAFAALDRRFNAVGLTHCAANRTR